MGKGACDEVFLFWLLMQDIDLTTDYVKSGKRSPWIINKILKYAVIDDIFMLFTLWMTPHIFGNTCFLIDLIICLFKLAIMFYEKRKRFEWRNFHIKSDYWTIIMFSAWLVTDKMHWNQWKSHKNNSYDNWKFYFFKL